MWCRQERLDGLKFDGLDLQMGNEALMQISAAIKEIIGLLVDRCLSWAVPSGGLASTSGNAS